jgi:O-antigen/teichoic acid export membrane protein
VRDEANREAPPPSGESPSGADAPPRWTRFVPSPWRQRVAASPTLRRFVPNTSWVLADRVARMGVGLIVGVWLARYLGPASFGHLNYALAFVALFSPLASLGLERIVVRELVSRRGVVGDVLGSALAVKLAGSACAAGLAVAVIAWLRPAGDPARALVPIVAGATIVQAFDIIDLWFQSQVRSRAVVLATGCAFLVTAGVRVTLILLRAPLVAFGWAFLAETSLTSLALIVAYRVGERPLPAWRARAAQMGTLLRDGWPLMLSSVMTMIYLRIDQVMLGQMSSAEELGTYTAAVKLVEAWYFLPTAIVASLFPSIVEAHGRDEALFYQRLQRLYDFMALLGYAIAVPLCLLAPFIVQLLFGPAYARSAPMLMVLAWSLPFTHLGVARGTFLTAMNWTGVYFVTVALGAVVNVALNFALIPRLGGMGAVIASCVAYWLAAHGSCYLYPPMIRTGNMLTRALLRPRL